ncbi:MAG: M24 family metallopeptidase [Isosphaeraceae bacterium]
MPAAQIDAAVRGHFAANGFDGHFPTHSGHGLGLGHPEPPYLVPESIETLQAHDVVALEPGLYLPGVGGMRFERNYLTTDCGHETLTRHQLALTPRAVASRSHRIAVWIAITPQRPSSVRSGPARSRAPGRSLARSRRR